MTETEPHILEEVHIQATPEQVWAVLMDYDGLREWSNGFLGTDRPMKAGEVSIAYFYNPVTHGQIEFEHMVVAYEPNRRFGWSGNITGGHHDHHIYEMEPHADGGTVFRQRDGLLGKPSSFMTKLAEHGIGHSYKSFNTRLKNRVESQFGPQHSAD